MQERSDDIDSNYPLRNVCSLQEIMKSNIIFLATNPRYCDEAIKHNKWVQAMDEEIKIIEKNQI